MPAEIGRRLDFYLRWACQEEWAAIPNAAIAITAQQLIVKHWLREAMKVSPPDDLGNAAAAFGLLGTHEKILWFLRERCPALSKPPYPRFIRDYLMGLWDTWFTGRGLVVVRLRDVKRPAHEWKLVGRAVYALVTWGHGNYLAGNREMAAEVISQLTTLLADYGFYPASILASLPSAYEPIEDFSRWNTAQIEHETLIRASAAFLALQHMARAVSTT